MNPQNFQHFAVATVKGARPVDCRAAISRSYYAAFNIAAELLRNAGCSIGYGADAHGKVPQFLLAVNSNPSIVKAGSWVGEMKGVRNKADYRMGDKTVERVATAELWVRETSNYIASMQAAFADPGYSSVLSDLRAYEVKMQAGYRP